MSEEVSQMALGHYCLYIGEFMAGHGCGCLSLFKLTCHISLFSAPT